MDKKQMIKRIKAITGGFRTPASSAVVEDKATKLAKSFKGKMGGINSAQEYAMATLLTESSGVDVITAYNNIPNPANGHVKVPEDKFLQPLVCLVVSIDARGAGVFVNKPVVSLEAFSSFGTSRCLNPNGGLTGHINRSGSNVTSPYFRLATDEEIDLLTDAQLNFLISQYTA